MVAVAVRGAAWRIHLDIATGKGDVFRETAYIGSACYRPGEGWYGIEPDEPDIRAALAASVPEFLPFEEAMRRRR
ncbi:MAG TPA: hypothetical protein VEL07_15365 [Planctomycetota bacterium]|nr:hypothetical protein [Planctomycetota bacterium]